MPVSYTLRDGANVSTDEPLPASEVKVICNELSMCAHNPDCLNVRITQFMSTLLPANIIYVYILLHYFQVSISVLTNYIMFQAAKSVHIDYITFS